jgi:hypothetical protein
VAVGPHEQEHRLGELAVCPPQALAHLCHDEGLIALFWSMTKGSSAAPSSTDIAEADLETVIRNFLTGQYSNAVRVIGLNTAEGWSLDLSEDIAIEILQRAIDADENLGAACKPASNPARIEVLAGRQ